MNFSRSSTLEDHTLSDLLSNDIVSTGFGDNFYSSYIVVLLYSSRSRLLSSGTDVITGPWVDFSMIDPSVEKFGLIKNG